MVPLIVLNDKFDMSNQTLGTKNLKLLICKEIKNKWEYCNK